MKTWIESENSEGKSNTAIQNCDYGEGIFATKNLKPCDIIGLFNGYRYTAEEAHKIPASRYPYLLAMDMLKYNDPTKTVSVYIDPFKKSEKVNDCRKNIHGEITDDDRERLNMVWIEFLYHGFKYIAEVIIKPVETNKQIFTYYGEDYKCEPEKQSLANARKTKTNRKIKARSFELFPSKALFDLLLKETKSKSDDESIKKAKQAIEYNNVRYFAKDDSFICEYTDDKTGYQHTLAQQKQEIKCFITNVQEKLKNLMKYPNTPPEIAQRKEDTEIDMQIKLTYSAVEIEKQYWKIKEGDQKCALFNNVHFIKASEMFFCSYSRQNQKVFSNKSFGKCIIGCQYLFKTYPEDYKNIPPDFAQLIKPEVISKQKDFERKMQEFNKKYNIDSIIDPKEHAKIVNNIYFSIIKNQVYFKCRYKSTKTGVRTYVGNGRTVAECVIRCREKIKENKAQYRDTPIDFLEPIKLLSSEMIAKQKEFQKDVHEFNEAHGINDTIYSNDEIQIAKTLKGIYVKHCSPEKYRFLCAYFSSKKNKNIFVAGGKTLAECVLRSREIIEEKKEEFEDAPIDIAKARKDDENVIALRKKLEHKFQDSLNPLKSEEKVQLFYNMFYKSETEQFQCRYWSSTEKKALNVTNKNFFQCLAACQNKFEYLNKNVGMLKSIADLEKEGNIKLVEYAKII
jgi:hypothetical protein